MEKTTIKHWAIDDQPRKKLVQKGADGLSNSELFAILINNGAPGHNALGLAMELLHGCRNDLNRVASLSVKEMVKLRIRGLGEAKACTIAAALELGVRRNASGNKKETITCSGDIAHYLRARLEHKKKEVFAVVFLNRANKLIHLEIISEGGITGTVADPRIIFKKALEYDAVAIILCHNHPSGSLKPSMADELLTRKMKESAALLDIRLIDHIIVSNEGYFSFADEGVL